nr:MAG: ORF1 [Torque teno midi virus]
MPFYWKRRKRFWRPWNKWRRKTYKTRRRRYRKRRARRTFRRRRKTRRRHKVRRKRKTITIKQWQPDSIVNCKIKGYGTLVLGAEGKQCVCYTNVKQAWTPPKAPGGGGFGTEQFSLGYLYSQYILRKNIWTKSNIAKDLVRYIRAKFTFYRHPETDFIVNYERQPPFTINEFTYPFCHPAQLLLLKLTAAAANFRYSELGCCNTNQIITAFSINTDFFQQGNWANSKATYKPWLTIPSTLYYSDIVGTDSDWQNDSWTQKHVTQQTITDYNSSVNMDTGYFATKILTAKQISRDKHTLNPMAELPLVSFRYNPTLDTGKGNAIWLHSSLATSYDKPAIDKTLILQGYPLWQMLFGWLSYVQYIKKATDFFTAHILVIQSPAIKIGPTVSKQQIFIPLSNDFVNGKPPYGEPLTTWWRTHWYPNIYDQLPVINAIVQSGPFIPKYSQTKNSTWELKYFYNFFFKWGGPEITEPAVADPAAQPTYPVPDTMQTTIQIRDPKKQKYDSILHPWDYRRGNIKESALKRIRENLSIDSTFQPDESPTKRKRITGPCLTAPEEEDQEVKACLQALCEESTFQEIQEEKDLQELIKQQHHKQQELKWNILRLISDLKEKQQQLQLQTGFLH